MIGKLAHVRGHCDVVIASLVITAVSVACAVVLTACATRLPDGAVDFSLMRVAAEIAAVIAFIISFLVVDAIRRILKGKRSVERLAMTDDLTGLANRRAFLVAAERAIAGLNGTNFGGRTLNVNEARPKADRGGGGGHGGGGGGFSRGGPRQRREPRW